MSPRAIALSILLLVALAGGAWLVLGTESKRQDVVTEEDDAQREREDRAGKVGDPGTRSLGDSGREQLPGEAQKSGQRSGEDSRLPKGDAKIRVRFLQKGRPLVNREVRLSSMSGAGSSTHRSDGEGRLLVQGLRSGGYRFSLPGEDMPRGAALPVFQLRDHEEKDLGDLNVPMPATLKGSLRAEMGGAIADALITLGKPGFSDFLNEDADAPTTKSDAQGRFLLDRLAPGKFVLRVDHPSYVRLDRSLEVKEGEQVDLGVLELARGREIRGQVVDQQSKPIAGVTIQAQIQTRIGTSTVLGYSEARSVLTDAQGRFVMGGLGATTKLLLQKEGYQEKRDVDVDLDKGFARIELLAERGISGRVSGFAEGRGSQVQVHVAEHVKLAGGSLDMYVDRQSVRCDAEGKFRVTGLEKGDYRLVAALRGHGFSQKHVVTLGDRAVTGVELALQRGGELVVKAFDKQQRPIAGARIVLEAIEPLPKSKGQRVRMRGQGSIRLRGRTDDQGLAKIEGVFAGLARLSVQHDRYLGFVTEMPLVAGRQEKQVLLSLGGWIEGVALDSSGFPAKGAALMFAIKRGKTGGNVYEVDLEHEEGPGASPVRLEPLLTGSKGAFKTRAIAPGLYEVWFKSVREIRAGGASITFSDGNENKPGLVEVQVVEGRVSKVQLRKPVSGTLLGLVTYKGMPADKAQVFAWPAGKDSFDAKQGLADKDGRFRIPELEPGSWKYCAKPQKGGVATPTQTLEVPATGGEIHRNVQLGGGLIRGRCWMPAGRQLPPGLVAVLEEGVRPGQEAQKQSSRRISIVMTADSSGKRKLSQMVMRPPTDPEPVDIKKDGSFEIEYVAAGPWQLVIEGKGNVRMAVKSFDLAQNQTLDLGQIDLEPVFPVVLQVQDETGQPISMGTLAVYRKRKGLDSERVWGGLVQDGKVRIPGLAPGSYRLQFSKIDMGKGGKGEPQQADLEVQADGSATGTDFRFK